ncbi:helix-turn-helix transcriptional regulator [Mycobacterium koreense]|uniref:Uncharacterized protein n=1 Tax=Mycolicibacillus koreensis TaxID=1069220 RepID=A0A7I7SDB7_9MYCO|nr:helix-turn-helix transcriptional regulator [Mycolicibacillus koreensis]MCV7247721.1 helix-turn-helix transcriptional regulator [Mycolicibacillus koreensis]OSC34750.1 hypothetical protein B8W67_05735 [Mycolicibacillus koreensis]BBY54106.1 hypothetical protein MKOR_13570 [Mycolicibacillus koreensis]
MTDSAIDDGWQRLGATVRKARNDLGFHSRDSFAEAADVSLRVMADLESGTRDNFSERVISKVEAALGWASGTADRIVADPDFRPSAPATGNELVFQPPEFDRRPVDVDVAAVERLIAALTEVSRSSQFEQTRGEISKLLESATSLCWPYVVRLVEDNCLPGKQLHPSVAPVYEAFVAVADDFAPADPSSNYTQWLRGEDSTADAQQQQRYMQRWSESRRTRRLRRKRIES